MPQPKHILNHPQRICTRCGQTKSSTLFRYHGTVCSDCKPVSRFKYVDRRCKHCDKIKQVSNFDGMGQVCHECKTVPKIPKLKICKRCGKSQEVDNFSPKGKICYNCKKSTILNRDINIATAKRDYWQQQLDNLLKEKQ